MMQMVTPRLHLVAQHRQEAIVGAAVEAGGRLVEQPQPRARRHDARDREELALRIGEIDRPRVAAGLKLRRVERAFDALDARGLRGAPAGLP